MNDDGVEEAPPPDASAALTAEEPPADERPAEEPPPDDVPVVEATRRGVLTAVLAVALVVALVFAVVEGRRASSLRDREATRRRVATTAGAFGEALLSYDYAHLDQARQRLLRRATKRFADEY